MADRSVRYAVKITPQADALLGLIQKRNRNDPERLGEIQRSLLAAIEELRVGRPWIWLLDSEHAGASVIYDSPIRVHFVEADPATIMIVDVDELY